MEMLYSKKRKRTDTYRYKVNQGGEFSIRVSNGSERHVEIIFVDGKLHGVSHNLGDFNLRSNWHIFGGIAKEISNLEDSYQNRPAGE